MADDIKKGGFREGSGRKPLKESQKKVRRTVFLHPDLDRKISDVMDHHNLTKHGELIELLDENGMIDQLASEMGDTLEDSSGKPIFLA